MTQRIRFSILLMLVGIYATTASPVRAEVKELSAKYSIIEPGLSEKINIVLGTSGLVEVDFDFDIVILANPEVADVIMLDRRSFYILAKQIGSTNLQVLDGDKTTLAIVGLNITLDLEEIEKSIEDAVPGSSISVSSLNGQIKLTGSVLDQLGRNRAVQIAEIFSKTEIIDSISVLNPKQVYLEVRIIEASTNATQSLGTNLSSGNIALSFNNTGIQLQGPTLTSAVDALIENGSARYLASPTLTALSGQTASFLAGGEVPVPVSASDPNSVQYKEFGVRLSFTPTVYSNGLINLVLEPEVSQVDFSSGYTVGGATLPTFTTRRASTTVELRDGESFGIAGLLQNNETRNSSGLVGLSELPVIGPFFRSAKLKDQTTELLIIVTPHLTSPVSPSSNLSTPLDGTRGAQGGEYFLDGVLSQEDYTLKDALSGKGISGRYGPILSLGGQGAFATK